MAVVNLNFTANGGKYVATYEGDSGAVQMVCPSGTEITVCGDAGAGVYHLLSEGQMKGSNILRYLNMAGLNKVRITASQMPVKAVVNTKQ